MQDKYPQLIAPLQPTFDDLDVGGIVYNANYMVYCDRARNDFYASRGEHVMRMMEKDIVFAVAGCELKFQKPLFLHPYRMITRLTGSSDKCLFFEHAITDPGEGMSAAAPGVTENNVALDALAGLRFFAKYTLVCISLKHKASQSIPEDFRHQVTRL